ncbi:hypothetical protein SAMN06297129_2088 [Pseudooceanicola antarcticus]|uniref:Chemotaxis protein CheA n=1 Tax=Pseudooceanicola antarcticus TaxID=1247613 RepID=A0A285ITM8_9RHOB|nr:hypothetical protein [Pseudooceanicola antarcticus]PJE32034.1 hypothetical protein CVM39_02775 [Pseudooceanicola antarcticus]SNY51334.1 hypothetical protein SAMN06297129_2088 [Pseudooceanicola antarcticus]
MVESNKILTVSYGTFSCTLEGFDDAFDTMKAIAEYFRDLAADDRYFGAEPPTPDADMLARLAERNTSRRVNARTEEGNIVLSPDQAAATQPAPETASPQAAAPAPEGTAPAAPVAEAPAVAPEPQPEAVDAEDVSDDEMPLRPLRAPRIAAALAAAGDAALLASEPELETAASGNTAQLSQDTAAVEASGPTEAPQPPAEDNFDLADAAPELTLPEVDAPELDLSDPEGPEAETLIEDSIEALLRDEVTAKEDFAAAIALDDVTPEAETSPEIVEAQELAEEMPVSEAPTQIEDESVEDVATPDLTPSGEGWDSIAEAEEAIAIARAEPDDGEELPPASLGPTDVALKLQRIRDVVARRRQAALLPEAQSPQAPEAEAPAAEETVAENTAVEAPEADTSEAVAPETSAAEAPAQESPEPLASDDLPEVAEEAPLRLEPEAQAEAEAPAPPRPMARVIKVKRREPAESSLSPEQEDELLRELAQIEAGVDPAPQSREPGRSLRDTDHGAQMDRILRETDHHFEQEDSTRRRSALAHLRAAVAAKKAEREAGSDFAPREDTTDAYREDLAQVVRPRRPAIAHQSTTPARRSLARPAPLKLVAEQRIDAGSASPGPVRPRRVSIADLARAEDPTPEGTASDAPDQSFVDYAASVGARSLGEMLEAAASYMSFMEHQPLFSRPQLMSRVKSLQPEGFTREDGLRAFGQLLRDGKIRKAEAGRFSVSDLIGFRPEERAAG